MKKITFTVFLFIFSASGFCFTWTVNNVSNTFSPSSITITVGDDVNFVISSIHNVIEVSQSTWNANESAALSGGFSLPLGGGLIPAAQLTAGTHWYVCGPHASMGMKGMIIVNASTGIEDKDIQAMVNIYPNPAGDFVKIVFDEQMSGIPYLFTDITGRIILSGRTESETLLLDVSQFQKGLYFLRLDDRRRRTFKVIKK